MANRVMNAITRYSWFSYKTSQLKEGESLHRADTFKLQD